LYLNQRRRALNDLQHPFHSHVDIDALDVAARVEDTVSDNEVPVVDFEGVWRALARLPQRERTAVSLRYFERLPAHAIARELGITPGNARRIVHNGLVHLRAQLRSPSAELVQTGWPPRR
jgi:RNA polymerase sigma factor (sigma-70 family)